MLFRSDLGEIIYQREKYTNSVFGIPLYSLTITGNSKLSKTPIAERKYIIIVSRIYTYETSCSLVFEGLLKFLICIISKIIGGNQSAKMLLNQYIIKCFPCLNPDGIIIGNSFADNEGVIIDDLWNNSDSNINTIVRSIIKQIQNIRKRKKVELFINLHNHDKSNSFINGYSSDVIKAFPEWANIRIIPKTMSKLSEMFTYDESKFTTKVIISKINRMILYVNSFILSLRSKTVLHFIYLHKDIIQKFNLGTTQN